MPVELSIQEQGASELAVIARHLKRTGAGDLRKELYSAIQRATKPLKADVKAAALAKLPKRGGLNEFVAGAKLATKTAGGGRNPGVRITAKKAGHDVRAIDRGRLRHPVFGNRKRWVNQTISAGWFTDTLQDGAPKVRAEILDVLEAVAKRCVDG